MHSNYTLRFPRTGREAFGHEICFERDNKLDKWATITAALGLAFLLGFFLA